MNQGHTDEYHDALVDMLELIWGRGFMSPGGQGNIDNLLAGLDVRQRELLDIGCGLGGPALLVAGKYGGRVTGIDLEAPLIQRAKESARDTGLEDRVDFRVVTTGPLPFPAESFDVVYSSGAFTQVDDKAGIFTECYRVLKPGGALTAYDWMKVPGEYSEDMLYWFKMEGLTYAMETLEQHGQFLQDAGFENITLTDRSDWYREQVGREYEQIKGTLYDRMRELMGRENADYFVENWRAMLVVCEKGEMRQGYYRGFKPVDARQE